MHFFDDRLMYVPDVNWTFASSSIRRNAGGESFFVGIREVDDCVEHNPCIPASSCRNSFVLNNTFCVPAFVGTTSAQVDVGGSPLPTVVLPDTQPQHLIQFSGKYFNSPIPNSAVLTFGPASNPARYPCLTATQSGSPTGQVLCPCLCSCSCACFGSNCFSLALIAVLLFRRLLAIYQLQSVLI